MVKSKSNGHEIIYQDGIWRYVDTGEKISVRSCRHCGKDPIPVYVKIPIDNGEEKWEYVLMDACIAGIVAALQEGDVDMRASCCGHGDQSGNIMLQDGRILEIKKNKI